MNILNTEESTPDLELDNSFQLGQQQLAPTLEDEFERPAIEAEAKYQKDLLEWREKSSQDTDKNLLEFESYRPDEEEPVKKQRLIRSVLNAEHDLSPKNHTNYEMARAQVSSQMFGEELDDDQFFSKLQERAQGRKEAKDLDLSMVQSAFLSAMAPEDVNFDDWGAENIKGIITGEENAKNLARWNEHQDKIEEQYGDILPSIRGTYSTMTRGGDWIAYAKSQITGLDDEEKDKYLYGLRAALGNNPKPEIANKFKRLGINILKSGRGVKSAVRNAGEFAGNEIREGGTFGFARLFGSNEAAAEERNRAKDDELTAKYLREDQNFINELRSVFENEYDPVQLLAEEGSSAAAIESGAYQIPGALTTTAIAAIPVAGPAITYGSLAESSRQTYMAAILEEGRASGNPISRAEADVMASQMGKVAAVPAMLLERFQATAFTKNTGISRAVGKLDGVIKNSLARGATKFVVASTAETGVELTQEISDSLVQAAAASFSEEVPDVVWSNGEDGVFDDYFNKFLTTFTAVSPLGVISAHRSVGLEVKAQTFKEASPLERQAFGITKEDSDKIDAAKNPAELVEAYQTSIENKDGNSENAIASTKELASQLENKAQAELEMVEKGRLLGARTTQGSELMEVYNSQTGEVVAEGLDRSQTAGFIMNHFNIKEREKMQLHDEMVTQMEGAQLLQEGSDSVTEFLPFKNMTVAQAAVEFEGSEERLASEAADAERLDGGDGAIANAVFGAHIPAGASGRAENTNVLFGNSTLFTAIHEHTHEVRRRWMRDGTFTFIEQVDAISSIDDAFRELSLSRQENGETVTVRGADRTYLPDDFHDQSPQEQETLVDEAISQIAETFSLRTRNGEKTKFRELLNRNLAARVRRGDKGAIKLKAFVRAMRDWFGLNLERSQLMKKAEREGLLDSAGLDDLQAKIFGETAQGNHDAGVQEAYEGILDDNVPFSVGDARMSPSSGEMRQIGDAFISSEPAAFSIGAFHGTPHSVDEFSTKNIGSGEGAQAYGWGLYFAGNRNVADWYRRVLSRKGIISEFELDEDADHDEVSDAIDDGEFDTKTTRFLKALREDDWLGLDYPSEAIAVALGDEAADYEMSQELSDSLADLGGLYSVELGVEESELLDWDKPLSEQPLLAEWMRVEDWGLLVDAAIEADSGNREALKRGGYNSAYFGHVGSLYQYLESEYGGAKGLTEELAKSGLKGIKYLDGSSRSAGEGSSNYVIFNDSDIKITGKNGEAVQASEASFSVGSVTPEQDAQYLKLAQDPEGNKEELKDIIDETARKYGYNFSHRRKNEEDPRETGHVILFAEDRFSNENYGEYDYALKESLAVDVKLWMTSWYAEHLRGTNSYYEVMEFDEILEKAEELMNPIDIVDTAAFWDDSEAVSAFWNENEDRLLDEGLVAVKTPDGAVLFDPYSKKSAIKSTSGVTFDDKGEIIPLSQRFNESSDDIRFSVNSVNHKSSQLDIINNSNPAPNEFNTWVRSEKDILTFRESLLDDEWSEYDEFNPDYDKEMANEALDSGSIIVYSSYPIGQGVFVSPSRMEAESYAGDGVIYEREVKLDEVAWIDPTQGQYAKADKASFSVGNSKIADSIITDVSKRVKNPEAKVRVLGSVIERVAAQKREVDEMSVAFGKAVVKKAVVDPRTKKSLQKEAAFRQADLTEQYVNQVHEESGFILEQEELTKLKEQPIHEYLSNPNDPLHGQLTSKSQAIKQGKMSVKDGDFDGASNVSRTIFGGTLMPDQAAQELYEAGLIREPDIDLMWEALEKEYVSVTSRKEEFKNGKAKLQDAKKRARDESREWLDERLSEQERDHNPRTSMLRSLAMYDAILMALPIELRGKMGGYVQLAKLKTDEARLKFLLERMDKLEGVVDKWVSNQADQDLKKFFKRAAAKRQKSGKTDKGKFDGESHKIFTAIKDATKMSMEEIDKQVAAAESVVSQGSEVDSDTWVRNLMLTNLLPQFGDWKNQSAEGKTEALKAGWNVYERALLDAKIRDAEQRERYEAGREAFKAATGVTVKGKALQKKLQEQRNFDKTKSAKKTVKDLDLNLAGFSGLLERLFGTNELTEQLVERQRKAEMLQSQMRREAGDTVNNYFRELAGGELAGMHMVADLMKPTIETASGTYSEMQGLTATMMWMQEDGRKHMEGSKDEDGKVTSSWSYDQEFIDSIESKLSDEAKGFRSLLLQKYEEGYTPLNDVHKRVHYIDMPKVSNYSPLTVKSFMEAMDKGIDPFTMAGSGNASSAGFTKRRSSMAVAEPSFEDAFTVFISHSSQAAHFVAFAELSKDMNAILGQREVMTHVEVKAGQQGRVSLKSWLDFYNEGGAKSAGALLGINKFLHDTFGNLAKMALALRPSVTFIQTTILGGGMVDMPMRQYMKGMAKLASGQLDIKSAWKSEFIQQRFLDKPVILQALQSGDPSQAPNKMQYWVDKIAHYGISGADALLTSATYEIYRDHYTNEAKLMELEGEAAEEYVSLKTVRSTERVSQPTRTGTRSIMENTERSPFKIMGMAFASDSRMKSSLLAQTLTKGTKAEKARALMFYFIVNGFAAAVIRNVWRDARSDDDDEIFDAENWDLKAMMVATMFGPINGVPILGDQVSNAANDFFGERNFYGNLSDNIGKGAKPITKIDDYVNGDVDADRALRDMETIMTTVGAFNDKATPAKSIISLLRDLNKLKENAISE